VFERLLKNLGLQRLLAEQPTKLANLILPGSKVTPSSAGGAEPR
jgi:hypothetical protein